jgi:hypothetical protein
MKSAGDNLDIRRKRKWSLQRQFAAPLLVAWTFVVTFIAAAKLAPLRPIMSMTHLSLNVGNPYVRATHSLCGSIPLEMVEHLIPADMVYFQRRWQQSRTDWALALTWLLHQVRGVVKLMLHASLPFAHSLAWPVAKLHRNDNNP